MLHFKTMMIFILRTLCFNSFCPNVNKMQVGGGGGGGGGGGQ